MFRWRAPVRLASGALIGGTFRSAWARVSTAAELVDAVQQRVVAIQVDGVVRGIPMITLAPGYGCAAAPCNSGAKGLRLTRTGHVHVEGLIIEAADL